MEQSLVALLLASVVIIGIIDYFLTYIIIIDYDYIEDKFRPTN